MARKRTKVSAEAEFQQYELMLYSIASSFNTTTGLDFQDLFSDAQLAYLRAIKTYKPGHGEKSTWIFTCVRNQLRNRLHKSMRIIEHDAATIPNTVTNITYKTCLFRDRIETELSDCARDAARMVLHDPYTFLAMPGKTARGIVRKTLRAAGYKWTEIWKAMQELREFTRT